MSELPIKTTTRDFKKMKPSVFAKKVFSKRAITKSINRILQERKDELDLRKWMDIGRKEEREIKIRMIGLKLVVFGTLTFIFLSLKLLL